MPAPLDFARDERILYERGVTNEFAFISALRQLATDPAARGLLDDAAVVRVADVELVLTHDMIVEQVHFLPDDPPADVAWKLLAVNLSDLAAKGAEPRGILIGYTLAGDAAWDNAFIAGLGEALAAFGVPLLGGDTVAISKGAPRTLGLTAIGTAPAGQVPSRAEAAAGDTLWVTGTIGDAGAGLAILRRGLREPAALVDRYRRPRPRLAAGRALARMVSAMMDVSDGLLIDAQRLAAASGVAAEIAIDAIPLSPELTASAGAEREARLEAAVAGDDYELLFAASPRREQELLALSAELDLPLTRIGKLSEGEGLRLSDAGGAIPLPERLGYLHGSG